MANLSVCASVIPEGVKTTSGVSSSVYPLTTMVTNYLAPMPTEGSLTRWTEDGHSSLVGSVQNSTSSAKVHICPLYLMRHVRDGGQNYQTPVDVWVIHTLINLG